VVALDCMKDMVYFRRRHR